jgi:predicted DCC family thiol-disulfide oxidoreductase YuxK
MHDNAPITVYFDGHCAVCSREVALYRRLDRRTRICWLDLAGPTDVLHDAGFSLAAALDLLHVRDADGSLRIGLDAHLLMWERLPGLHWLARAVRRHAGLRRRLETVYLAFTRRRPGLARRRVGL